MLIGTMGAEPEFKMLNNGQMPVATVSIATNETYKDQQGVSQERTEWHRLVFWNKLAEIVHQYLHKGSQIYVEGKLRTRSFDDQNGQKKYVTEIQVTEMLMLGGKNDLQQNNSAPQPQQNYSAPQQNYQQNGYQQSSGNWNNTQRQQPQPQQNYQQSNQQMPAPPQQRYPF